jgi:vancomycin resistance protein YoaR
MIGAKNDELSKFIYLPYNWEVLARFKALVKKLKEPHRIAIPKVRPAVLPLILAIVISQPFIISIIYDFKYQGRVVPGVYLGQARLGGQTAEEALATINSIFKVATPSTTIKIGPKEFVVTGYELGFNYLPAETLQKALTVGRSGSPLDMVRDEWQAFWQHTTVWPVYTYNSSQLDKALQTIEVQIVKPAKNAGFTYSSGQLLVTSEETGWRLPSESLKSRVIQKFERLDYSPIEVTLLADQPTTYKEDLVKYEASVSALLGSLPTVNFNNQVWRIDPETALAILKFSKDNVSYDEEIVKDWVRVVAKDVDADPRGQVLQVDATGRVTNFSPSQTGYKVNIAASAKSIGEALIFSPTPKVVDLVVVKQEPPASANSYGIKELIGLGESNFYGSIPGRIHNLDLASSRINGALIAPGEEVSFNKLVGEVSAATGYDEAYIISEGRTVLGTGGGLCQVSTTLFRAALNAGLPILARTAHAYRVHYYEPPLGLDATVYSPSVDLVFKNDTSAYILIQREINIGQNYLAFKLYGTSDGRITTVSAPIITNEVGAPATLYQEDPTLPKGVTKQVDWSAPGADAVFYRKVIRGGEVLQDDTFVSHYAPWRAIFLVGTKE